MKSKRDLQIVEADLNSHEHCQSVLDLEDQYASGILPESSGLTKKVKADLIPALKAFPTTFIFLAYLNDKPAGIAVCFYGFSTFAAKRLVNVHDLAVHPDYQNQGIGRRLLEAVIEKAKAEQCCKVTLEVEENNQRARHLYGALGFNEAKYCECAGKQLFLSKSIG